MPLELLPASELILWTYKEGLLSRVAHDLCITAGQFRAPLEVEGDAFSVEVEVQVSALRVKGQVKSEGVVPLRAKDHAEIEGNLRGRRVLQADRFPLVRYRGSGQREGEGVSLQGELSLCGTSRPLALRAELRAEGEELVVSGEVRFLQSTFGIKPFSALMGAIKVQDGLRVSWSLRYPRA